MSADFEKQFNKKQSFLDHFLHPSRVLIEGEKKLFEMWVEAVEAGKLQSTPEEVEKTRAR